MNERITQFERLWLARPPLPRLMVFDMPQPGWLVRQTNEHHLLSPMKQEAFWRADTQERKALLATLRPIPELVRPELARPELARPHLVRQTNEHHRLPPDKLEAYWVADALEKAELLATLSPIESIFSDIEILRSFL